MTTNAQILLTALKAKSMHEQEAIKVLFPEPKYVGTLDPTVDTDTKIKVQTEYWQWDVNLYGQAHSRPVNGTHVDFIPTNNYSDIVYAAFKELKEADLVYASNNGYNSYSYHAK